MAICKECICYESCKDWAEQYEDKEFPYRECSFFKPKADVVEVVRCKDCKRCNIYSPVKPIDEEATDAYFCKVWERYTEPTVFCSYGERKEK